MTKYDARLLEIADSNTSLPLETSFSKLVARISSNIGSRTRRSSGAFSLRIGLLGRPRPGVRNHCGDVFAGGKLSVGSFRAAAAMQYLPGGDEMLEITSQRWRRARHEGVIAHESHHLTELDVMYIDNIPVDTTLCGRSTTSDCWLRPASCSSFKVLDHALHDALRCKHRRRRGSARAEAGRGETIRPGGRAIERLLKNFVPPKRDTDSSPEIQLLQYIRIAGLPEPVPQFRVWLSPTRWVDLDFAWPWLKIFIEFDP